MIMYLKSSISISLLNGCIHNCGYCILSSLPERNGIKIDKQTAKELIEKLLQYKFYSPNVPITVNNISEPFSNEQAFNCTLDILKALNNRRIKNPVVVITKGYLSCEQVEELSSFSLNLIVVYSFCGMTERIEHLDRSRQIKTIQCLSQSDSIKLIHYWRPIIDGINNDAETLSYVSEISTKYFLCSVISGLRLNSYIREKLEKMGYVLTFPYDADHKIISEDTYNKAVLFSNRRGAFPCFRKTSCAISYLLGHEDYNGYAKKNQFCSSQCANYFNCFKSPYIPTEAAIQSLLNIVGVTFPFEHTIEKIHIHGALTQEQLSFLRHNTKTPVISDIVLPSNNNEILSQ